MRNEQAALRGPILMRFAEAIPGGPRVPFRYDLVRQISQVNCNGEWVDAVDSTLTLEASTKKTGVGQETTDDD
jgi:hypothetical protein